LVVDAEGLPLRRRRLPTLLGGHHVEQPLDRRLLVALVVAVGLAAADDGEAGAGQGVDGFDAAVVQHREPAELVQVHGAAALRRRKDHGEQVKAGPEHGDPRHVAREVVHCANLRRRKPTRWRPKCTSMPTATMAQEKYGMSQPGLSTTCRTVPFSV